ncbi:MAG: hypothetical protein E6767_02370 [Dysgonomonas sp.]|nr:hypothetical protein [Dysgonomonas sp.]
MKIILALLLLLPLTLIAQEEAEPQPKISYKTESINGHDFVFKFVSTPTDFYDNMEEVELYRGSRKLLTHRLKDKSSDSNSIAVEVGNYQIKDSTLTFFSYWGKVGDAPVSPYGARKQVYNVQANGKVKMTENLIYLDAGYMMASYDGYKGQMFLDSVPRTAEDKKLFEEYKQTIEKEYNASFVKNKKQETALFKEVRVVLAEEIQAATKGWDELSKVWSWSQY